MKGKIELPAIEISKLTFYPLTKDRWKDFELLFGEKGACGGCWCMSWRLKKAQFDEQKGVANKKAMKKIIYGNETPGVLAYYEEKPIAWCSAAPREKFIRLENSKVLKRIDEKPVWSISCIFIIKEFRRRGISKHLLKAVIKFCEFKGAKIVEAYPQEPYGPNFPAAFAWTGIPSSFENAGFKVAERRSKMRPIMRYYIE
jgi:GNAT superfamily N-acetyltransferase